MTLNARYAQLQSGCSFRQIANEVLNSAQPAHGSIAAFWGKVKLHADFYNEERLA